MIVEHLPVALVVAPLLAAPVCFLATARVAWLIALAASLVSLACAVSLCIEVLDSGTVVAMLGGWMAPWGIEYRVDLLTLPVILIVSGIGSVVLLSAHVSIEREIAADIRSLFYAAWSLCVAGLLGIAVTGDVFNLFVFLEISALSSYILIALGRDRRALTASFQYLVMGTIGATFILIGIGFLYMGAGTLNMSDLASRLSGLQASRALQSAFAFLTVGIGLKMAMFPLHLWLPGAYAHAPSTVSAFLSATSTKVAVYVLIRFVYSVFGFEFSLQTMPLSMILTALSVMAVLIASTVAIFEENLKRMLAYSSVAQIGYMLLGIGLATAAGLAAGVAHLFNHALIKGALFLSLACIAFSSGDVIRSGIAGVGRRMPWTCAAFVVGALSLIGVPLTAGFSSKWLLILAAVEIGWWPIAVVVVAGSLLSVIYVWRVIEVMYRPAEDDEPTGEAPLMLLLPAWIMAIANIYFGVFTEINIGIAERAAALLMGAAG